MPGESGEFHAAQRAAILPILHVLTESGFQIPCMRARGGSKVILIGSKTQYFHFPVPEDRQNVWSEQRKEAVLLAMGRAAGIGGLSYFSLTAVLMMGSTSVYRRRHLPGRAADQAR